MARSVDFELGHVLFMDVVGYSKTLIDDQRQVLRDLNEIVQATDQFQGAEAEKKLICLATGDGMALAFFTSPSAPVRCAIEITRALRALPHVKVRMGIHSGPVSRMDDVNKSANIAGGGINMAQRVMDCGDAGHILLSQRVAEDLAQFREWNAAVHDLGESEVKHGTKLHLFNFFGDGFGNPAVPSKLGGATRSRSAVGTAKLRRLVPIILAAAVAAIVTMVMAIHYFRSHEKPGLRSSSVISTKSIAVLPFENLSHDPDNAYFADGIQEEILTRLSKIGDLKVISRTSTQRYKSSPANLLEIAQQLGVAHILEGSVQRSADQVRVNVQLINAQTDSHLWADNFDRKLTDIFAVESEIAGKIAGTLQARLTGPEQRAIAAHPTENSEAHQLYLKGRYFWHKRTEEGLKKSIAYFNQAIEKDPRYALAYSGLGDSYMYMLRLGYLHGLHPKEAYLRAQAAATKALEIDDNLAEAHTSLALIKMEYEWDWAGSERSFQRAIQLNPRLDEAHHQYSHYLMSMGRTRESLAESLRALELNPLSLPLNGHLAWHYLFARQYDQAIQQCEKTFEMDPGYPEAHDFLGLTYEQKGMYEQAIAEFQKAINVSGNSSHITAELGHAYAVAGKSREALEILDNLKGLSKEMYISAYDVAAILIGLGQKDQAFEWLENAYEDRSEALRYLKVDPRLDSLRSDSRFADLVRRVGLTE